MESLLAFSNDIRKTFEGYGQEDRKRFEDYETKMRAVIESLTAPGMKKQKTSLEAEEPDSGIDATTITTSTQASTVTTSSTGSTRPPRSAKTVASVNLKLPKLGTKLRQEIKLEPISETSSISRNSKKSDTKENDLNSINIKREKISVGVRGQSSSSIDTDSSVLVIPNEVNIITVSDDEDDDGGEADKNDDNKMPPPMMPAPKKVPTKKTRANPKNLAVPEANSSESNSSQSFDASASHLQPKKTKKAKKSKKPVLPIVEIKQEKDGEDDGLPIGEVPESKKVSKKKSSEKVIPDTGSKNATLESVYEDASDKVPSQPANGLAASATYVLPKTSIKENGHTEQASKVNINGKTKTSISSLITEDDSDDDLPIQILKTTKNNKELFNPCIQSPMKAKVAAFERQAQEYSSPVPPIRQTRTKTRQLAKQHSESSTSSTISATSTSKLPKPTTPSVEIRYPIKEHTPLGHSASHSKHNGFRTQMPSSSSKLASLTRPATAQPLKVRSRDNSVEDMARTKEAMMEKKRKGDERIRRAQLQREAQEKEKIEKIEKAMKLKQEKEAAREAAKQQKLQEEQLKQQRAAEKKREKEIKQKAELAEAAKQERDQILSKRIADEKAFLDSMKQSKKEEPKSLYTFDMLETDDSTDDEGTVSKNRPNRPPPPAWSLRANAKRDIIMQAGISVNTIDMLFSCKPTTPDLAAIFPQIDSKHLKRNSSAFWNTPPRYSQLPKY